MVAFFLLIGATFFTVTDHIIAFNESSYVKTAQMPFSRRIASENLNWHVPVPNSGQCATVMEPNHFISFSASGVKSRFLSTCYWRGANSDAYHYTVDFMSNTARGSV